MQIKSWSSKQACKRIVRFRFLRFCRRWSFGRLRSRNRSRRRWFQTVQKRTWRNLGNRCLRLRGFWLREIAEIAEIWFGILVGLAEISEVVIKVSKIVIALSKNSKWHEMYFLCADKLQLRSYFDMKNVCTAFVVPFAAGAAAAPLPIIPSRSPGDGALPDASSNLERYSKCTICWKYFANGFGL